VSTVRLACLLVALSALALGQPYAADDGFDRPRELIGDQERPALELVVDRGAITLVRVDRGRIVAATLQPGGELDQSERVLASGTTYWDLVAASGGGDPAVYAWYARDFTTGRYLYDWHSGGETRRLLETTQPLDLRLAVGPDGPVAYVARPEPGGARLERLRWEGGEAALVFASDLGLGGIDVALDGDGRPHLAFLEGFTEATEFGVQSEWNVRYLGPSGEAIDLGPAAPPPARVRVLGGGAAVAWTGVAGELLVAQTGTDAGGGAPERAQVVGSGRPLGLVGDRLIWYDGASIVTAPWPLAPEPSRNAVWSPMTIDRAAAERDGEGVTYLAWAGRRVGGGYALLASDDAAPLQRTFSDELAALFGWSPWSVVEEAFAQAAGAMMVGLVATFALLPPLWLVAALIVRHLRHDASRTTGVVLALLALGALVAVVASAPGLDPPRIRSLLGLPWAAPIAFAVAALVTLVALRRLDAESLQTIVAAASLTTFVAVSVLAFATFQAWLALLGM
jgi:hypothetical protein